MTKAWRVLFILAAVATAKADEATCAWHFAVSPVGWFNHLVEGILLEAAPSPTVFVEKGDRLADLSASMREATADKQGWLLWNETRHLLVAHGNAAVMAYAALESHFDDQPVTAALTLSWYQGVAPGDPIPPEAKPAHQTQVTGAPGQTLKGEWNNSMDGTIAAVRHECELSTSNTWGGGARLVLAWEEKAKDRLLQWDLSHAVQFDTRGKARPRTLAQVTSPSGESWTVTASLRDFQDDGTPCEESQWREADGKAVLIPYRTVLVPKVPERIKLGPREVMLQSRFVPRFEARVVFDAANLPSAQKPPTYPAGIVWSDLRKWLREASVPHELKPFVPLPMLDLKPLAKAMDKQVDEIAFLGWDPCSGQLLVAGPKDSPDPFDDFFHCGTDLTTAVLMKSSRRAGDGSTTTGGILLESPSGQKSTLTCRPPGEDENENEFVPLVDFEIEPTIGALHRDLDVRYRWQQMGLNREATTSTEGQIRLIDSKEAVLQSNGDKAKTDVISIRADIVHIHEPEAP